MEDASKYQGSKTDFKTYQHTEKHLNLTSRQQSLHTEKFLESTKSPQKR